MENIENMEKFVNSNTENTANSNTENTANSNTENTANFTSKVLLGAGLLLIPISLIAYVYTKSQS
jgi:hypothetical protein